jgi:major membrane immunogen (membrane-anchored lipoprotein)
MAVAESTKTERIRNLNDAFRRSFTGGRVMLTSGVAALDDEVKAKVLTAVGTFEDFDEDNDPHKEHDFLSVNVCGHEIFAKIDYYDREMRFGADDSSDPEQTTRVLTIMLASEY